MYMDVFGLVLIVSGVMVISAMNTVYSVIWLVLAFISGVVLFIGAGADFLGLIFLVVYVGAIAILFLFVVMMLHLGGLRDLLDVSNYVLAGFLVGGVIYLEVLVYLVGGSVGFMCEGGVSWGFGVNWFLLEILRGITWLLVVSTGWFLVCRGSTYVIWKSLLSSVLRQFVLVAGFYMFILAFMVGGCGFKGALLIMGAGLFAIESCFLVGSFLRGGYVGFQVCFFIAIWILLGLYCEFNLRELVMVCNFWVLLWFFWLNWWDPKPGRVLGVCLQGPLMVVAGFQYELVVEVLGWFGIFVFCWGVIGECLRGVSSWMWGSGVGGTVVGRNFVDHHPYFKGKIFLVDQGTNVVEEVGPNGCITRKIGGRDPRVWRAVSRLINGDPDLSPGRRDEYLSFYAFCWEIGEVVGVQTRSGRLVGIGPWSEFKSGVSSSDVETMGIRCNGDNGVN